MQRFKKIISVMVFLRYLMKFGGITIMGILAINGSSRENSNSDVMLTCLLKGIEHNEIKLKHYAIQPIWDQRHSQKIWRAADDDYDQLLTKLIASKTIIFATPIYWYGVSGLLKNFIDRWSESLATVPNFREIIKNKRIYVLIVGGDAPHIKGLPIIEQFNYICEFLNWQFVDYVIGKGNMPSDVLKDKFAMQKLQQLNTQLNGGINNEQ
ncbi:flavin reductase [Liquorilactobacillus sucicola DSM 21376 = JCM 15457]|uniref:Flavin reductase n=2 Tax=Liquorilactobacillus sucicola TaxID=519050 RepID=A0A0R2DN42_9LACO|nr:flavin reductase [Liquorilactobacillus sucicola DSM 21376 = JCM 15457]